MLPVQGETKQEVTWAGRFKVLLLWTCSVNRKWCQWPETTFSCWKEAPHRYDPLVSYKLCFGSRIFQLYFWSSTVLWPSDVCGRVNFKQPHFSPGADSLCSFLDRNRKRCWFYYSTWILGWTFWAFDTMIKSFLCAVWSFFCYSIRHKTETESHQLLLTHKPLRIKYN